MSNRLEELARIRGVTLSDKIRQLASDLVQDCLSACSEFMTSESDGSASDCHAAITSRFAVSRRNVFSLQPQVLVIACKGLSAKLVPVRPPPGEYAALGCGNKVQWLCNGHTFTVETEDYVKGIDCPCTVTVLEDQTYWVDYANKRL
jgi:hypothetical protein